LAFYVTAYNYGYTFKNMWSRRYQCCVKCGRTDRRHLGRGLCERCYQKSVEKHHKPENQVRGKAGKILTKSFLENEYYENRRSLSDIASYASCSRQYVYKKMKEHGIIPRTKRASRILALEKGKVSFNRINDNGVMETITLQRNKVDGNFFKKWSDEMAYVAGVIYTDGSLRPGILRDPSCSDTLRVGRLTVSQKEPELLNKILALMDCDAKLLFRKRQTFDTGAAGELYYFHINNDEIYDDLLKIGLSPAKSYKIKFPEIPEIFVRHFIRGCWDGDGSVYLEKKSNTIRASFVSGSFGFIEGMLRQFYKNGFDKRTIYNSGKSFYFRFSGSQCEKLYHYFYDNVGEHLYLMRKYLIFKEAIKRL